MRPRAHVGDGGPGAHTLPCSYGRAWTTDREYHSHGRAPRHRPSLSPASAGEAGRPVYAGQPAADDTHVGPPVSVQGRLVLGRIQCQIVNEAHFAVQEGVATPADVDTAEDLRGLERMHEREHRFKMGKKRP